MIIELHILALPERRKRALSVLLTRASLHYSACVLKVYSRVLYLRLHVLQEWSVGELPDIPLPEVKFLGYHYYMHNLNTLIIVSKRVPKEILYDVALSTAKISRE